MKVVHIPLKSTDIAVDGSLAVTPSQMLKMTAQGRAICSQSLSTLSYYDAPEQGSGTLLLENQRGVDMNILWTESVRSKRRIRETERKIQRTL